MQAGELVLHSGAHAQVFVLDSLAEDRQLKPIEIRARKRRPGEEEGGLQCSGRAHARVSRQVAEQRRVETTDLDSHAAERPGNAQRIGHPGGATGS